MFIKFTTGVDRLFRGACDTCFFDLNRSLDFKSISVTGLYSSTTEPRRTLRHAQSRKHRGHAPGMGGHGDHAACDIYLSANGSAPSPMPLGIFLCASLNVLRWLCGETGSRMCNTFSEKL